MDVNQSEEIQANLNRAEKSIEAARQLALEGYFDFAASRAYYGAFYAATALLLHEGMEFGTGLFVTVLRHSGQVTSAPYAGPTPVPFSEATPVRFSEPTGQAGQAQITLKLKTSQITPRASARAAPVPFARATPLSKDKIRLMVFYLLPRAEHPGLWLPVT